MTETKQSEEAITFKMFCFSIMITGIIGLIGMFILIDWKILLPALGGVLLVFLIAGLILLLSYWLARRTK